MEETKAGNMSLAILIPSDVSLEFYNVGLAFLTSQSFHHLYMDINMPTYITHANTYMFICLFYELK